MPVHFWLAMLVHEAGNKTPLGFLVGFSALFPAMALAERLLKVLALRHAEARHRLRDRGLTMSLFRNRVSDSRIASPSSRWCVFGAREVSTLLLPGADFSVCRDTDVGN